MDVSQFTALLQMLGRIADSLDRISLHCDKTTLLLAGIQVSLNEINEHPGFEAIQNIASSLDSIRRVGLPVEQG